MLVEKWNEVVVDYSYAGGNVIPEFASSDWGKSWKPYGIRSPVEIQVFKKLQTYKKKVKFYLSIPWMNIDGGEWSTSRPGCFSPGKERR
jgi:hypothetical protein